MQLNWTSSQLEEFLNSTNDTHKNPGFWNKIFRHLPQRKCSSVYKFVLRKYDVNNYKGRWTMQEEEELIKLVNIHGRKFKLIAKELNRTPKNVEA